MKLRPVHVFWGALCAPIIGWGLGRLVGNPPAVIVPNNGAQYSPGESNDLKRLAESALRSEAHLRELTAIERVRAEKDGLVAAVADRKTQQRKVLSATCAGCHTPARAGDGLDAGVILYLDDGSKQLKPFEAQEWVKIRQQILSGKMPKGRPLDPDARSLFE